MAKKDRVARRQARKQKAAIAREQRTARKAIRKKSHTDRVAQRKEAKLERQHIRQEGRADRLKQRIKDRQRVNKKQADEVKASIEEEAITSGDDPKVIAARRIEESPKMKGQLKQYVSEATGQDPDELTDSVEDLAGQALLLRGEELADISPEVQQEIEADGDDMTEEFEDFDFAAAAADLNELEFPENFEGFGVIDPGTWATISGAAKGGLEVIAQRQFKKGKKFLGKTEKEWKAATDPNAPTEILYRETAEQYKSNFLKENLPAIIAAVVIITIIGLLAYKGAKK
jgi:hypothetical protein